MPIGKVGGAESSRSGSVEVLAFQRVSTDALGGCPVNHDKVVEVHFLTQPPLTLWEADSCLVTGGCNKFLCSLLGLHWLYLVPMRSDSSPQGRGRNPLTLQGQGMAGRRTCYCHAGDRHRWKFMPLLTFADKGIGAKLPPPTYYFEGVGCLLSNMLLPS